MFKTSSNNNPNSNSKHQPQLIAYLQPKQSPSYWLLPYGTATSVTQIKQLNSIQASKTSQHTPTTALLPASSLTLANLELPPGVKANEALLLIEDQLSQPLEELTSALINQTGREVCLAVLSSEQLTTWQEELAAEQIYITQWQAETLALKQLWQEEQPLVLLNTTEPSLEVWLTSSLSLFSLPTNWLEESPAPSKLNQLLTGLGIKETPHLEELNLEKRLCWLAPALANQTALWQLTWWQKLLNHPKLRQLSQLNTHFSQGLAWLTPYKRPLLPWGLSLVALLIAGLFNLLQPQQADAYLSQTAIKFENQLGLALTHPNAHQKFNQHLTNLGEQLSYQEARFNAWQQLNQLLKHHPEAQLTRLELTPEGLTAQLTAPNAEKLNQLNQQLHQLGGQVNQQNNLLNWQLTANELNTYE